MTCQMCGRAVEPGARYCDQCGTRVSYTGATVRLTPEPVLRRATSPVLMQVRSGMEVRAADGVLLGRVREIWLGVDPATSTEPCDDEICSRVEVRHGLFGREVRYIPYSAIAEVVETTVILNVDAATVNTTSWSQKPHWIPVRKTAFDATGEVQPLGVRRSRHGS